MELNNVIATRRNKKVYADGDNCIKLFNKDFSIAEILNEALNQARVQETGLNIPNIRAITMIDGQWAIISDYIKGTTLDKLMEQHPEKEDEYLEKFVNLQMEIHTKRCPLLTKLIDKMNRKITETDLEATLRFNLHARLESMPRHKKLCHGDYNPSNVIVKDDGTMYVLDWSHATQGHASADVARTYLLFRLKDQDERAEKYLDLFCKKSGTDKEYVKSWMPIVAASQSVKHHEEEREFLMSWVNIV